VIDLRGWRPQPLHLCTDPARGGRWTSLRSPRREWLWTNPAPGVSERRTEVTPGAAFVDAGGVEECLPTVRGTPDHGAAWSRPWTVLAADQPDIQRHTVAVSLPGRPESGALQLWRTIRPADGQILLDYVLAGPPRASLLHAVHLLVDVTPDTRLDVPGCTTMTLLDDPVPGAARLGHWPSGLDRLGPDDGSATCAIVHDCAAATVVDGDDALELRWASDPETPVSLMLWRNLRGWPAATPYRSIGIEPMVGRAADLASATPDAPALLQPARLRPDGTLRWSLQLRSFSRS
jgi:hypothetical protein